METGRPGTGVKIDGVLANPDRGADMNQDKLKVAKYDPLTFECLSCDQQFNASGKSVEQVADEVSAHISQKHPELAYSDLHLKKADGRTQLRDLVHVFTGNGRKKFLINLAGVD